MNDLDIYIKSKDVVHRRVAGESILVPVRGNVADMQRLYALDAVAEYAWDCLDGECSMSEIAVLIANNFDISEEIALADLDPFFSDLESQTLISKVA